MGANCSCKPCCSKHRESTTGVISAPDEIVAVQAETEHFVSIHPALSPPSSAAPQFEECLAAPSIAVAPFSLPPGERLTMMMFGMTGSGKSSLGNLVARSSIFTAGDDTASMTNPDSVTKYEAEDGSLTILDTIGLGDTEIDQDKVVASIRDVALSAINGVDILLFVMRNERITDDAIMRLIYVIECLWGYECLLNLYVVVTCAPKYLRNRMDADAWIKRQVELNWRFKHIYSLVNSNPNRFIFIDNPDPASGEPGVEERRSMSYDVVMKMFCLHPRNIIPPFTHAMMRKVQALAEAERKDLEAKELEVQRIHERLNKGRTEAKRKASEEQLSGNTSKEGVVTLEAVKDADLYDNVSSVGSTVSTTCSLNTNSQVNEADLQRAINDRIISRMALESKLEQIKHDRKFAEEAAQQIEVSVMKFTNRLQGRVPDGLPDGDAAVIQAKAKAGRRVLAMLKAKARRVMNAIAGTTASKELGVATRCYTRGCGRSCWNGHSCCDDCVASDGFQHSPECDQKLCSAVGLTFTPESSDGNVERMVDCVVARLRQSFNGTPASEVYLHRWGANSEGLNPITFNGYCYWHNALAAVETEFLQTPDMKPKLIAALWRRADRNCDGKVDLSEFKALFGES